MQSLANLYFITADKELSESMGLDEFGFMMYGICTFCWSYGILWDFILTSSLIYIQFYFKTRPTLPSSSDTVQCTNQQKKLTCMSCTADLHPSKSLATVLTLLKMWQNLQYGLGSYRYFEVFQDKSEKKSWFKAERQRSCTSVGN